MRCDTQALWAFFADLGKSLAVVFVMLLAMGRRVPAAKICLLLVGYWYLCPVMGWIKSVFVPDGVVFYKPTLSEKGVIVLKT